jgi:hypothetical protein
MTTKTRIKALEEKIAPTNESYTVVDWDWSDGRPIECSRKGITLSKDLHECEDCTEILPKNRYVHRVIWIDGPTKRELQKCPPSTSD